MPKSTKRLRPARKPTATMPRMPHDPNRAELLTGNPMQLEPDLVHLTSVALGFHVTVYSLGFAPGPFTYQIMPSDEHDPGMPEGFWSWYVTRCKQCFSTPERAAAEFVRYCRGYAARGMAQDTTE